MAKIVAIVEGDGEVEAVPVLIRRIGSEVSPLVPPDVSRSIRVPRQRIVKEGELERYVRLAAARGGDDGRIVILLDANGDCPAELASDIPATRPRGALGPPHRGGIGKTGVRGMVHIGD